MNESNNKPHINFKCMFGFHTWNEWEKEGEFLRTYYPLGIKTLEGFRQEVTRIERKCLTCGLIERKIVNN